MCLLAAAGARPSNRKRRLRRRRRPSAPAPARPARAPRARPRGRPGRAPQAEPQAPAPAPDAPPRRREPSGGGGTDRPGARAPRPAAGPLLPRLDIYFPEGDLDLRVNRLINKTFFEGQVKYNFVNGDITRLPALPLLRLPAHDPVHRLRLHRVRPTSTRTSPSDFDRVRGTLLLIQWPHSYNYRTFVLTEIDRISTNEGERGGRVLRPPRPHQHLRPAGLPDRHAGRGAVERHRRRDPGAHRAAVLGLPRVRARRCDAHRRRHLRLPLGLGDFDYVKFEFEALKRFDISARTFLVGRLRGGTFPYIGQGGSRDAAAGPRPIDLYAVPAVRSVPPRRAREPEGAGRPARGLEQLLPPGSTSFPGSSTAIATSCGWTWQNWYWILYTGFGTIGLDRNVYSDFGSYIPDAGIGFESSFRLRKYRFFLSGIVAQALKGDGGVEARISVKSYR